MAENKNKRFEDKTNLQAANQQLRATKQQLRSANQQLKANTQQLKANEEDLKQTNEYLESLLQYTGVSVVVWNRELKIIRFNHAFERLIGKKAKAVLGCSIEVLFPTDRRDETMIRIRHVMEGQQWEAVEIPISGVDGTVRTVLWNSASIHASDGRTVIATIAQGQDITERKRVEEEVLKKQEQLRSLAVQLSLSEECERRRIAEGLHDDIIQPLTFLDIKLKTFLDSATNSELTDSYREMRTIIGKLINDARNFTLDLSYPVLYELGFEKAVKQWLISEVKEKHGLQIIFKDDRKGKPLDGGIQTFLFKAVKELLVNVIKHAEATKVKVSLAKDRNNIVICVKDDGVGFSVKKNAKRVTGFGLFNIHDRIDYLGGSFEIKSKHGSGTQAVITIPLKQEKSV